MFQNAAIDVAIGLILMYLVLSLLCTVVNEFIANRLDLRSRSLAAGLKELLDDPVVRNAFYAHGLIAGTQRALANSGSVVWSTVPQTRAAAPTPGASGEAAFVSATPVVSARVPVTGSDALPGAQGATVSAPAAAPTAETQPGQHPSYLSAEMFTLALVGALTGTRLAQGQATPGFADVQAAIEGLPPSRIKSALQASLMSAQGDFHAFRQSVTTWFDDAMDRLSGAYKRHLKLISIVVGCTVAVVMNADTFSAGRALWSDNALRAQVARVAEAVQNEPPPVVPAHSATGVARAYRAAVDTLSPLPIGWNDPLHDWPGGSDGVGTWVWFAAAKIAGWFATGLALSLGAPFWFDLLSKFMNLRGTGVKPGRRDAKG